MVDPDYLKAIARKLEMLNLSETGSSSNRIKHKKETDIINQMGDSAKAYLDRIKGNS